MYPTKTKNSDIVITTCGRELDLSKTELVIEKSNSLFSYNVHKLSSGEYVIAEKFYANPFNNRYILLNDDQIELLKNLQLVKSLELKVTCGAALAGIGAAAGAIAPPDSCFHSNNSL